MGLEQDKKAFKNNLMAVIMAVLLPGLLLLIYLYLPDLFEFESLSFFILFEIVATVIPLLLFPVFRKAFGSAYANVFRGGKIGTSFILLLPFLIVKRLAMLGAEVAGESQLNIVWILESFRSGICEELIFRGIPFVILMGLWKGKKPWAGFVILSSLAFSSIHLVNMSINDETGMMLQLLFTFSMAVLFSGVLVRTSNVIGLLLCHVANNLIAFSVNGDAGTVTGGKLSDYMLNIIIYLVYFVFGLVYMIQAEKEERRKTMNIS